MEIYKDPGIYNSTSIYESGAGGGGGGGSTVNINGRDYRTTTIGGVTWLAENLDFKFSGCGIGGGFVSDSPHAWYYDNDEATYGIDGVRKCGLLYNWHAVNLLNENRNDLIPGWHVPTNDEWTALADAVGGTAVAGTSLKADDVEWASSWNGTNEYEFAVLPAGYYNGNFYSIFYIASYWTITQSGSRSYNKSFDTGPTMIQDTNERKFCYSVRLVKD